jgi:hypothetical protein
MAASQRGEISGPYGVPSPSEKADEPERRRTEKKERKVRSHQNVLKGESAFVVLHR